MCHPPTPPRPAQAEGALWPPGDTCALPAAPALQPGEAVSTQWAGRGPVSVHLGVCPSGLVVVLPTVLTVLFPLFKAVMIPPPQSSGTSAPPTPHPIGCLVSGENFPFIPQMLNVSRVPNMGPESPLPPSALLQDPALPEPGAGGSHRLSHGPSRVTGTLV